MDKFLCTKDSPVVEVKQGKLKGFFFDGVYRFLGVPYAKAKRFEMPEEPDSWEGIRNALAYGKICPILDDPTPNDEIVVPHRFWPDSEHCQNLNIFTNCLDPNAKKAVMVWFHGGGFSSGSAIEHVAYEGDSLAKYDDVVTVCVNHRLNAFGHMDVSAFGEKFAHSANVGIADLVASLKWVKENIANFGGDPENVTIFGQSGGGGKVTALGQSPAADGLFQKAILMSGIFSFSQLSADADNAVDWKEFTLEVMRRLGIDNDIEKLQKANYRLFIMAVNKAVKKFAKEGKRIGWAPKKDGWYLGDPMDVGFNPSYLKVPTMIGTVLSEFSRPAPYVLKDMDKAAQDKVIFDQFGEENGKKLLELYNKAYPGKPDLFAKDLDTMFTPASIAYAREKSKGEAPVYRYQLASVFDYDGGRTPWHCADIPFAFHNSAVIPFTYSIDYRERLENEICGAFVNFAKTGDPNNAYLPKWDPCTFEDVNCMVFDETSEVRTNFDDELLAFYRKALPPFDFSKFIPKDEDDEDEEKAWLY